MQPPRKSENFLHHKRPHKKIDAAGMAQKLT
jgi:hypothetical protein